MADSLHSFKSSNALSAAYNKMLCSLLIFNQALTSHWNYNLSVKFAGVTHSNKLLKPLDSTFQKYFCRVKSDQAIGLITFRKNSLSNIKLKFLADSLLSFKCSNVLCKSFSYCTNSIRNFIWTFTVKLHSQYQNTSDFKLNVPLDSPLTIRY